MRTLDECFAYVCLDVRWRILEGTSSVCERSGTMLAKDAGRHRYVNFRKDLPINLFCLEILLCQTGVLFIRNLVRITPNNKRRGREQRNVCLLTTYYLLCFSLTYHCEIPLLHFFNSHWSAFIRCQEALTVVDILFILLLIPVNHHTMTHLNYKSCNYSRKPTAPCSCWTV